MAIVELDLLGFIPDSVKQRLFGTLIDLLVDQAEKVVSGQVADALKKLRSDADFRGAFDQALQRAVRRFVDQYAEIDREVLVALMRQPNRFWEARPVREALREMMRRPGTYLEPERRSLEQSCGELLPKFEQERVNRAVACFLRFLAEEVMVIPQLQPVYGVQLQKLTLDQGRAMIAALRDLQADQRQGMMALLEVVSRTLELPGASALALPEPPKVYHNLPNPDYVRFVGREEELARVHELLSPASRAWVITIDGIGGIGKSALALEAAHRYLRDYDNLRPEERFQAIIWSSAKASVLTIDGIASRRQITRTLQDIYTSIAVTLEREDITRAHPEEQDEVVTKALARQRTLLIVDNLETVDDERVHAFLRELPPPTKAIVTTRHRIDVAYPIRLVGMQKRDGLALIAQECEKKGTTLTGAEAERLYRRTGGVPLAIVWSVAKIGYGFSVNAVLRRLAQPTSDVAQFCFEGTVQLIRDKPAHKLLMALTLFVPDASRTALGYAADLPELDRDESLVELERFSLVNRREGRFAMMPLTRAFASAELEKNAEFAQEARRRSVNYLKQLFVPSEGEYSWRYASRSFFEEGQNLLEAIEWAYAHGDANDVFLLTQAVFEYLDATGEWNKLLALCTRALSLARSIRDPIAIARFAREEGWILRQWGRLDEAESRFSEALRQYQQAGNEPEGESIALQHLGSICRKRREFEKARELSDKALEIADTLGEGDLRALVLTERGKLARDMGEWQLAWDTFAEVRDWFEKRVEETPRDEILARSNWGHLAIVAYHLGRYDEAKDLCLRSLEFFETQGTRSFLPTLKYRLALAEEASGEFDAALGHGREAVDWFDRLGMKPDLVEAQILLQRLEQRQAG